MMIALVYELKDTSKVEKLFSGWQEKLIYSCLQKVMVKIYVTDSENLSAALLLQSLTYSSNTIFLQQTKPKDIPFGFWCFY